LIDISLSQLNPSDLLENEQYADLALEILQKQINKLQGDISNVDYF
jgi:hypothetical protein